MKSMQIGSKKIGNGEPCFIVAEAGANWRYCEDMEKNFVHALEMIDIAAEAKADAIKFQLYRAEKMYVKNAGFAYYLGKKKSVYNMIEELELPHEWLPKLKEYCDKKNIIFLCSPFDEESVDELEKIDVAAYKIASYEITHLPLIRYIAKKGKPIIFSCGSSELRDIEAAIDCMNKEGVDQIALMQCTAKYPAPLSTINLRVLSSLKEKLEIPVGLSDHSREPLLASLGAVALGANLIEKHYTTDNNLPGPDHSFAILADELKELVCSIRKMEQALGTEKKGVQEEENEIYNFARRYIYAKSDINVGEILHKDNLIILRSGEAEHGIEPKYLDEIIGKKAKVHINKGQEIKWGLILE